MTSIGKALLATKEDAEVEAMLGSQLGRTATDRLLAELALVRVERLAFSVGGLQEGLNSVAVAV